MSRKYQAKKCSFCFSEFCGRRHRHTEGWSPSMVAFLEEESGLNVGNKNMCVCEACRSSIRNSMKARDDGEPFQLRWLKDKRVPRCCVPSCNSVDIKAEKHEFTWETICGSLGLGSVDHPGDISLCTKHYQQVYKLQVSLMHVKPVVC